MDSNLSSCPLASNTFRAIKRMQVVNPDSGKLAIDAVPFDRTSKAASTLRFMTLNVFLDFKLGSCN